MIRTIFQNYHWLHDSCPEDKRNCDEYRDLSLIRNTGRTVWTNSINYRRRGCKVYDYSESAYDVKKRQRNITCVDHRAYIGRMRNHEYLQ